MAELTRTSTYLMLSPHLKKHSNMESIWKFPWDGEDDGNIIPLTQEEADKAREVFKKIRGSKHKEVVDLGKSEHITKTVI